MNNCRLGKLRSAAIGSVFLWIPASHGIWSLGSFETIVERFASDCGVITCGDVAGFKSCSLVKVLRNGVESTSKKFRFFLKTCEPCRPIQRLRG